MKKNVIRNVLTPTDFWQKNLSYCDWFTRSESSDHLQPSPPNLSHIHWGPVFISIRQTRNILHIVFTKCISTSI